MRRIMMGLAAASFVVPALAADVEAGKERSAACQHCHGTDGKALANDRAVLKQAVASKRWGDRSVVVVERDGESLELDVPLCRVRPEPCEDEDEE